MTTDTIGLISKLSVPFFPKLDLAYQFHSGLLQSEGTFLHVKEEANAVSASEASVFYSTFSFFTTNILSAIGFVDRHGLDIGSSQG